MAIYKRKTKRKDGKETESWYVEVSLPGGRKIKRNEGRESGI
jgi:hypothetical protein